MSKTQERLQRTFMEIKGFLGRAQRDGTVKNDDVVLEAARKIGIAIQLAGKGIQESAESEKFLDIIHYLGQAKGLMKVLNHILKETIGKEFKQIREAEPKDFQ